MQFLCINRINVLYIVLRIYELVNSGFIRKIGYIFYFIEYIVLYINLIIKFMKENYQYVFNEK